VKRIALTALVIVALASPVHAQVGDSVAAAPESLLRGAVLSDSVLAVPDPSPIAASRSGEITGAVLGGIIGAVLTRGLSCRFSETGCGWQWKALALGGFIGGFIGAGIGSAADE
jgi:hypothetical protein